ncbi:MAG: exo-alpha-sialidase [Chloroflexi bacterium]|nr:MAG: exo-alpha-sialidase [Chloroflexota bacterium]
MLRRFGIALTVIALTMLASSTGTTASVPQGTQSDKDYAKSFARYGVTNVVATTQRTSCYTPEVPFSTSDGPNDGYTGMSDCLGASNTGEALGPYATQVGSNPGYPAANPMLVKDHSESDIRVDPTNSNHLIGQSKWFVSAEGYNHLLGFYESFDGGASWPTQGHVPGYEGWTDNTDPVGAFDRYGNFYSLILPYQFFYNADGSHNFQKNTNREPNPAQPAELISVSVRPHGASGANDWITTHNGKPDFVAPYDSQGREPDKQWIGVDTNPASPFVDNVYAMWVVFTGPYTPHPVVSIAHANADGTHTDWSAPIALPEIGGTPQGSTYLFPHVTPDGAVYTTLVNETPAHGSFASTIWLDQSHDGGLTWTTGPAIVKDIPEPPFRFTNTTFRDGITATFGTGNILVAGHYPLYVSWEDGSTGLDNVLLSASYDGGGTWTSPIQVNDNASPVDEFQPNLDVAANGTVSVAFYDRRLACPAAGTAEATGAGIALDQVNPAYSGSLPPYGATNYCVNASIQYYTPTLQPKGHNIRISQHTWDPQLNAAHTACPTCLTTFIGDYFGITSAGGKSYTTSVSTYDDGTNAAHYQQQVIAILSIP